MKSSTLIPSALIALAPLLPAAIAYDTSEFGSMVPGPLTCGDDYTAVEPATTDDFAPVVQRLTQTQAGAGNAMTVCVENYGCNDEDRKHWNEGWGTASCDDDSGAAIWLQTWSEEDLCVTRENIGKMAQVIIDECASDDGTTKGYMTVGEEQWIEVGWATSCDSPSNPHNHCD